MISSKESICWFYIMSCKMHLQMSLLNNSRPGGGGGWGGGGRREGEVKWHLKLNISLLQVLDFIILCDNSFLVVF